ncbi:MAG: PD-(D/E)XK nuclease family protein, partial [Bacteroidota bacterium]|nr:PD-(D/E)XK nuclease family protein [Bacteroidota bacterium]
PQGLSAKWMNLFSENPGICLEDWMKEIEQYQTSYSTQEEKEKHKERLNFILNTAEERSERISIEKISNYYSFFYNIFNRRCAVTTDEQIKTRLTRLCNAFKEMLSVLQLAPETELDAFGLQKLLQLLLRPVSVIPFEKEAGSLHEISDAGLLAADCDDLLWFGFTANKSGGTVWNEWTSEEIFWLKEKGVLIETAIVKAKRAFWFSTQWLRFVKKRLIFVIPTTDKGEAAQPHAFHPFLNACFTNLHSITINVEQPCDMQLLNSSHQLTKRITVNNIPSFPAYWQIKTHLLTKRDEESFSSLENLMKYPYRWVLRYKADLYRGNTFCLPDNFMFYGTLSHKIFQELLLTAGILEFRENKSKELYRITAEKFINQKGLLLHAQGEEANLKIFRETLFEKLRILLKHLKDNNWQVEGCEIKGSGKIGDETVGGYCDLLLSRMKDNKIEKAIVDLKYSGRSKYRKLMEDGQDLQLAIYSKIFHPLANFCPTSYFIITDGLLFTTCKEAFKNGIILRHDIHYTATYAEVIQKIENTTKFRRKELSQGKIEIGESVCMEDLDVFELDSDSYILPIVEKKTKCRSDYNDYVTFIDTE